MEPREPERTKKFEKVDRETANQNRATTLALRVGEEVVIKGVVCRVEVIGARVFSLAVLRKAENRRWRRKRFKLTR